MKRIKFSILVLPAAALLLIAGLFIFLRSGGDDPPAPPPGPAGPSQEFRIAVLAPLSGPKEAEGRSIERGARIAAEQLNLAGGVDDHRFVLKVIDSGGSLDLAAERIERGIQIGGVEAVLGTVEFAAAEIASLAAEQASVPFVMLINGPLHTCLSDNKRQVAEHLWQLGYTGVMTVEPFLIHLADKLAKPGEKFVLSYFGTNDYRSRREADHVIDTAGGLGFAVGAEEYVDPRVTDHYELLRRMLGTPASVLFISVAPRSLRSFMTQVQKMSVRRDMLLAGMRSFNEETIAELGELAEGVATDIGYHPRLDNRPNKIFLASWNLAHPNTPPTSLSVRAYSAVRILATAFAVANSKELSALTKAIAAVDIQMPQGRLLADPENHSFTQPLYVGVVEKGALKREQYLGDVSHPRMTGCDPLNAPPPTPAPTPEPRFGIYDE